MSANQTVLGAGIAETLATLRQWRLAPWPVIRGWAIGSLAIALTLVGATILVASLSRPRGAAFVYGVPDPATTADLLHIFVRNLLVLSLHALACVAGYLARRSLPMQALLRRGVDRWVHEHAGGVALAFVLCATLFSVASQAYLLGHIARDAAAILEVSPQALVACLLPHAIPELTAVFLPLAAFLIACRRGDFHHLLAATAVTTAIALPVIAASALVETYLTPEIVKGLLL